MIGINSAVINRFKSILGPFTSARSISLLSNLKPSLNSTKSFKRVGRGPSSGLGKTSGRGQKGQKARGKVKPWFEGGQTPIVKLFPKTGFKRVTAPELQALNLTRIVDFVQSGRINLKEGDVLDMRLMKKSGLISGTLRDGVKVLATGKENLTFPIKIEATRASTEAIRAIERAGGEFTARYFSKLSLRAHINPEHFLLTRGHIPLKARPTKRRDINFYSRADKRGYLIKEKNSLLTAIEEAKSFKPRNNNQNKKVSLESLGSKTNEGASGFAGSGIFKLADLKL
ncbi:hypothetical protein WICMUC_000901 [Wickerhamomyces mucosus]|uniref:Large ribosomal subunit protein uL15/eL18 domain-containing protein n=1 Tax=Wickerhamomyces mucosus TaxID=1378264 RepID=A0A9P8PWE9_9ASCO|nr:hypothetical protein WICMUC_000901 [Wickerhamomyces mucosus]